MIRITAFECGTKLFFALISFVFAFLQQAEANRQIEIATKKVQKCIKHMAVFQKQIEYFNNQLIRPLKSRETE
jgi:hypothetical protein